MQFRCPHCGVLQSFDDIEVIVIDPKREIKDLEGKCINCGMAIYHEIDDIINSIKFVDLMGNKLDWRKLKWAKI